MKIVILVICALTGFWVVGAIVEYFKHKMPKTGPLPHANAESDYRAETQPTRVDPMEEACRILELNQPFTADQLRGAYRQQMSKYHPDKVSSLGPEFQELAEKRSKEINQAYDFLSRFFK